MSSEIIAKDMRQSTSRGAPAQLKKCPTVIYRSTQPAGEGIGIGIEGPAVGASDTPNKCASL